MKNFRSFLKDKKAVKYFAVGVLTGIMLTAVLISGVKISVELYKAYMRSYYAKIDALYSAENNNPDENIDSVSVAYNDGKVTLPMNYLPFECSKNDYISFTSSTNGCSFTAQYYDAENRNVYCCFSESKDFITLFETNEKVIPCAYIKDALYLRSNSSLYRIVVDEKGLFEMDSFSRVIDKKAVPVFIEENKMFLKVDGEQDDYYVLLDTLTGKYEQVYDCNESVSEIPKGFISKSEAEKIALDAIHDINRFPDFALSEDMVLFCSVENDNLDGNPEYYDTHLIHRPDFSGYFGGYFEEIPEYCWKVELVADISDWWMPRAVLYINAETGTVSFVKTFLPD